MLNFTAELNIIIDIKHHFVRDLVAQGTIELQYCPSSQMLADMLTKGLSRDSLVFSQNTINVK